MTKLAKKTRTAEIRMGSHKEVSDTIGELLSVAQAEACALRV
jgi:hypothetical protein